MIKWIKNFFAVKKRYIAHIEMLEERIISLESRLLESQVLLAKQSELLSVIAGVQCDIVGVLFKSSDSNKQDAIDAQSASILVIPPDDDFIN